jgi:hypothetical protein
VVLRIGDDFLEGIATRIIEHLQKKGLMDPSVPTRDAVQVVRELFIKNFREEEQIEVEAEKTMESLLTGKAGYDRHKMLLLLKNRIAEQRGFVL